MASTLIINLVQFGLLALLWLFVLAAVRVVRTDLTAPTRSASAPRAGSGSRQPRGHKAGHARKLVVTDGPLAGTSLGLDTSPVTLGRADSSTLVLTDDYASNHHARLIPADGNWSLEDLGSTNGTYLGSTKVTQPVPVPLGAKIRIGKTVLELRR